MDAARECFEPLLALENDDFIAVDYDNNGINVSMTDHEIYIGYGDNSLDEACPIFDNDYVFLKVVGNPFTVDGRFLGSLIGRIIELEEPDQDLVMSGEPHARLNDCVAVIRTGFGVSVVAWNDLFDEKIQRWPNWEFGAPFGRINDESFSTQTLLCGQFDAAMVYRLAGNPFL
jgi:hypothetical protein